VQYSYWVSFCLGLTLASPHFYYALERCAETAHLSFTNEYYSLSSSRLTPLQELLPVMHETTDFVNSPPSISRNCSSLRLATISLLKSSASVLLSFFIVKKLKRKNKRGNNYFTNYSASASTVEPPLHEF